MRGTRVVLIGLLLACSAVVAHAELKVAFEDSAVTIAGATAGGDLAWFSVSRHSPEYWQVVVVRRDGILTDEDKNGTVTIKLDEPVAPASVWVAFDLTTGASVIGAPGGHVERLRITDAADRVRPGAAGIVDFLRDRHEVVEVLLVRPGQGAWGLAVGDGGASDGDGKNDGAIRLALASLRAVHSTSASLAELAPGDVLAVIDTQTLEYAIVSFAAGT